MKKKSFKIRKLINPSIKIGDVVKLVDGSGLTCDEIQYPIIVRDYPDVLESTRRIENLIAIVVGIGQEYVTNPSYDEVYLQDISITINGILFRTASQFVAKVNQ